jgi:putative membrane protein
MAYNQGFYNLFLALGVVVGLVLLWSGLELTGLVLALFACVCMVLAALVLITSNRRMLRAALVQGAAPLVAVVCFAVALAMG